MTMTEPRIAAERILRLSREQRQQLCTSLASLDDATELIPDVPPFGLISDADRVLLPDDAVDAYPLGQVQLGMIFHMLFDTQRGATRGGPAAYHNVATSHFRIPAFSAGAFRRAVELLLLRHEIFRTSMHVAGFSEPLAVVHRSRPARLEVIDLRDEPAEWQVEQLAEFEREQNACLVDLTDAPLIRFYIHLFTDHDIKLTLVEPHSISDGWSTHLTLVELVTNYESLLSGREPDEPLIRLCYRQFVAQERAAVGSPAHRLFWQTFLAHAAGTAVPARAVAAPDGTGHKAYRELDPALTNAVLELARKEGLPPRTVLLAAHFKVLSILCEVDDIVAGVSFNGRLERADGTEIRGMFLNTLPVRLDGLRTTWQELLRSVYSIECMILPFRRYPLAEILRVAGSRVRPATLFSYHHFHSVRQIRDGQIVDTMENVTDDSRTNVPFEVAFIRSAEREDTLTILIDIDPAIFTSDDVESFAQTYLDVLTQMTRDVRAPHRVLAGSTIRAGRAIVPSRDIKDVPKS